MFKLQKLYYKLLHYSVAQGLPVEKRIRNGNECKILKIVVTADDTMYLHMLFREHMGFWTKKAVDGKHLLYPKIYKNFEGIKSYSPDVGDVITLTEDFIIYIKYSSDHMQIKDVPNVNRLRINAKYQDLPSSLEPVFTIGLFVLCVSFITGFI